MDKIKLYKILDIETVEEFKYYENIEAFFEENEMIEKNLILDLLSEIDMDFFNEATENYFEKLLEDIPDEENELYVLIDSIWRKLHGLISTSYNSEKNKLVEELYSFRKWYSVDCLVLDKKNNNEISVCDARYSMLASKLTGEWYSFDYRLALNYDIDGFDINIAEII